MELPQSRPFKAQGREPRHDFLSLCSHSTLHTDPKPTPSSSSQGSHLKTHDFLQPLECVGGSKEETSKTDTTSEPPAQLQHVLPGGIGTYTISSRSYFPTHQRVPKPELSPPMMFTASGGGGSVERNVVDAAAVASGFNLWNESGTGNKGQTRKENNAVERADVVTTMGQWPMVELKNNESQGLSCSLGDFHGCFTFVSESISSSWFIGNYLYLLRVFRLWLLFVLLFKPLYFLLT